MSESSEGLFYQIFLRKWHPQPTIPCAIVIFLLIGLFFLILGIVITSINQQIVEIKISNYDCYGQCCQNSSQYSNQTCSFEIELPDMDGPVFLFYELTGFYQNHRKYVKSKGNAQLAAQSFKEAEKYCENSIYNRDLHDYQRKFYIHKNGTYQLRNDSTNYKTLNLNEIANPCGLIAKSFFNDTYTLWEDSSKTKMVKINENGITWPNDRGQKFKTNNNVSQTWIDVENEHFIIWMKTAGLPDFRKIWGKISEGIKKKKYLLEFQNNYNPQSFGGSKNLILSTAGPFGGKNIFLGVAYLIAGCMCILIAIIFWIKGKYGGKHYGRKLE